MDLVANTIMLHNVSDLTDVLIGMTAEGWSLTKELVGRLSPYTRDYVRRFGQFMLDMDDLPPPLVSRPLRLGFLRRVRAEITKIFTYPDQTSLLSREVVVNLVGQTTTEKGLRIHAELHANDYPAGVKISDEIMADLPLERDDFHGEWNYRLKPRSHRS